MASRAEHRTGLTPTLKHFAFQYLAQGVGVHRVTDHPAYDTAIVRTLYDFTVPEDLPEDLPEGVPDSVPAQGAFVVELWKAGKRIRWVEFGVRCIGGGGEPILREL